MDNKPSLTGVLTAVLLAAPVAVALPPNARVIDGDALFVGNPLPSISPDGEWVAYFSGGHICLANIRNGKPRRLQEVFSLWSEIRQQPDYKPVKGEPADLEPGADAKTYRTIAQRMNGTIGRLEWAHDSSGFSWHTYVRAKEHLSFWSATTDGDVKKLSDVRLDAREYLRRGRVSNDERFIILELLKDRLIWKVAGNRLQPTAFHDLIPSSTSDRWLGVEKGSRQLVVTNAEFEVTQRYEHYRSERSFGFDLQWTSDERYVLMRNQVGFDHYSNWEGLWLDLRTGDHTPLEGRFMNESVAFTGREGEFYRIGNTGERSRSWSGDVLTDSHVTVFARGGAEPQHLWRTMHNPDDWARQSWKYLLFPPHVNSDASLFAVAFRTSDADGGWRWELLDRSGTRAPIPGEGRYNSQFPCQVVGFAADDTVLVGFTETELIAIPPVAGTR